VSVITASSFTSQVNLIEPIVQGLAHGAAYGLLGLGLVLIYKSNRIFNFAQGEFAGVGALTTYLFYTGYSFLPHLSYWVAVPLGLCAGVLIALATERAVIRPLFHRPRVVVVVGTVGVTLLLIGVEGLIFPHGGALPTVDGVLHLSTPYVTKIDGVPLLDQSLITLGVLGVLAIAALLFFRFTATGTAILAVSQDSTAARIVGISIERISMLTWAIAGLLGAIAGVLLAVPPEGTVTPGAFTGTILTVAFSAAVLGGMTSLPGAFVGGLLMGLIEAFANADYNFIPGLSQLPSAQSEVAVAVVLLLVLLVRPQGLLGEET
jgi:branched-chain amino acid transport system permease protein